MRAQSDQGEVVIAGSEPANIQIHMHYTYVFAVALVLS